MIKGKVLSSGIALPVIFSIFIIIGIYHDIFAQNSHNSVIPTAPQFSADHGFYYSSFLLEITSSDPNVRIFYTRDCSSPGITNGTLYTEPVRIDGTSVIRAVCIDNDLSLSRTTTRTYLFPDDIIHQPYNPDGYPSTWSAFTSINGVAPGDYEMDPELIADQQFANLLKESLQDLPAISLVTNKENLFSKVADQESGGIYIYTGATGSLGNNWERKVSFEYFSSMDTGSFHVDCGIQIHGGEGRRPEKSPKHSFRLIFKSEYGPSKLNYPFFGADAVSEFNTLVLRAGFNNTWIHHSAVERSRAQYLRDRWIKDIQMEMGHYSSHGSYVHLFINGLYWGIYNPSERVDSDFAESYLNGDAKDFDVIKDYSEAADGDISAWNKLMTIANAGLEQDEFYQAIRGNNPDGTPNSGIKALVDVVNLADYMILNFYAGNMDWDHHNWIAIRNRVSPGKGFRFFCWDAERTIESVSSNILTKNNDNCPSRLFQQLLQNDEFRRLFSDRVQKFCFNNGALTPSIASAIWTIRAGQIDKAIIAESARWGDYRRDVHQYQTVGPFDLYTRESHWLPQMNYMLNTYFPDRTAVFINQLKKVNLFPTINAPLFFVNNNLILQNKVKTGDVLTMTTESGNIWFTNDGSDPAILRPDPAISPSAIMYKGSVIIKGSSHIKARTYYNGSWSALNEQCFIIPSDFDDLKITEIHYHPLDQSEIEDPEFEFIELKNTGTSTLYLEGIQFIKGIRYRFPSETYLKPNQFIVLASNSKYFNDRYHFMPFDQYNGQLDNSGDELIVLSAENDTLFSLVYDDENGWPLPPDGEGNSLVPVDINPSVNQDLPQSWRESHKKGGSPGADDIFISENSSTEIIKVFQNYPNPFSDMTYLSYQLFTEANIRITVHSLSGNIVTTLEDEEKHSGFYQTEWNGTYQNKHNVPPGMYFYRIEAISSGGHSILTGKMLLIRN